jgi:hypothetical protein
MAFSPFFLFLHQPLFLCMWFNPCMKEIVMQWVITYTTSKLTKNSIFLYLFLFNLVPNRPAHVSSLIPLISNLAPHVIFHLHLLCSSLCRLQKPSLSSRSAMLAALAVPCHLKCAIKPTTVTATITPSPLFFLHSPSFNRLCEGH